MTHRSQAAQFEIAESRRIAGKPGLLVDLFCGRKTEADVRAALGMPAAKPTGVTVCPTCGGTGEIDDSQDDAPSPPAAAAMAGWDRAFANVHAATAADSPQPDAAAMAVWDRAFANVHARRPRAQS